MSFSIDDKSRVRATIHSSFAALIEQGFDLSEANVEQDSVLGEVLEVTLSHARRDRKLSFQLMRAEGREALAIFIGRGVSDEFLIDDYLAAHRISASVLQNCRWSAGSELAASLGMCLSCLKKVLNDHLSHVLDGTDWPDVPIDWRGLR